MPAWDSNPAERIINDRHFRITDPGPLHAPIQTFSIHRDETLELILEARSGGDSVSTAVDIPAGTVRKATERVALAAPGQVTATFIGVTPRSVTNAADERGIPETRETAKVHRIEGRMPTTSAPAYTIDWLANVSGHSLYWPDSVRTEIETRTTRTFGHDPDSVVAEAITERNTSGTRAAKLSVAGVTFYLCENDAKTDPLRPGYILYTGAADSEFRRKVRDCLSFALGIYLVHLGTTTYTSDWAIAEFSSISAYSMDGKAFRLVGLPPAPLHGSWQFDVERERLSRIVNGLFALYDTLKFRHLSWAYWHAQSATSHIAAAHFGAAIEALLRRYADQHREAIPAKPIADRTVWKAFCAQIGDHISMLPIDETSKLLVRSNLGSLNRLPLKALLDGVAGHLRIKIGDAERAAWKRRDDAAHGNDLEPGGELELIRENKLLGILFNRLLLRMTNASDQYRDYFTLGHKIRRLEEPCA